MESSVRGSKSTEIRQPSVDGSGAPRGYAFASFRLDAQHRVLYDKDGQAVPLAPKVLDTLLVFVEQAGELVDKRALIERIWPRVVVEENNLNQCISALRRALGERPGEHRFIVTEPGRGYRFVASVAPWTPDDGAVAAIGSASVSGGRPEQRRRAPRLRYVVGGIAAALLAMPLLWWLLTGDGRLSTERASSEGSASLPRPVLPNSVAVLPFEDQSPDPSKPYIALGLHWDVIGKLAQLNLNVITRDAVLAYASHGSSYRDIAAALGVQSLLVGTVRYTDEDVQFSVALVDPPTGFLLWSPEPYRVGIGELFAVQADIATNVANELDAQFSAAEARRIQLRPAISANAQRAYYRAFAARDAGDRREALRLLQEATDLDPRFAAAHAEHALLAARSLIDWGYDRAVAVDPERLAQQTLESAQRALALDSELPNAHLALAELYALSWRWTEADAAFAAAHAVGRNHAEVLLFYSQFKTFQGHYRAALPLAQRHFELSPPAPDPVARGSGSLYALWLAHVYSGDVEAAIHYLEEHLALHPRQVPARLNLGFVEARRGNRAVAEDAFRLVDEQTASDRSPTFAANLAYGYARIGLPDEAARLFNEVASRASDRPVGAGTWAMAHLAVGRRDEALESLELALERIARHEPDTGWFSLMILKHDLTADPILATPAFARLRARIRGS